MLTPQEVQERKFEKAVFGGYDTGGVDAFLESLTEDYGTLYKDNAILKNKLKMLVDKIEEYRSVDDVMRKTLLTAQQNAQDILQAAQKRADEILKAAEASARDRSSEVTRAAEHEAARLDAAKKETVRFVNQLRELYRKELELLAAIPDMRVEESPKAVRADKMKSAVDEIDSSLAARIAAEDAARAAEEALKVRAAAEQPPVPAVPPVPPVPTASPVTPVPQEAPKDISVDARVYEVNFGDGRQADFSDIWEPDEDTVVPRPRTDFTDLNLEFGPNYHPGTKNR